MGGGGREPGQDPGSPGGAALISVLVLTLNEEVGLGECLASVRFSDDVLVFDSGSTDRTIEIVRAAGVRMMTRVFDDYGSQRQAALELGAFKHPWLLVLDADERVDAELAREMAEVAAGKDGGHGGFRIRRKDHYLNGRWIPHATLYPTWHARFFRHRQSRYELRTVHEHPMIQGTLGIFRGHLLHYSFIKGMDAWVEKHRRYARLEAVEGLALRRIALDWKALFSFDTGIRRRALKALSYRLPCRAAVRFAYMMLVRLAFLDGRQGVA